MAKHSAVQESEAFTMIEEVAPQPQVVPPAEPTMAVPVNFFAQLLAHMQEMANNNVKALAQVVDNIRKPVIDPVKEAQHERARRTKEQSEKSFWEQARNRAQNCTHLREDMSSAIAWAEQSDVYADYPDLCEAKKITGAAQQTRLMRGTCQHCQTLFSPRREECVSDFVYENYSAMRRIPTGRGLDTVRHIG